MTGRTAGRWCAGCGADGGPAAPGWGSATAVLSVHARDDYARDLAPCPACAADPGRAAARYRDSFAAWRRRAVIRHAVGR